MVTGEQPTVYASSVVHEQLHPFSGQHEHDNRMEILVPSEMDEVGTKTGETLICIRQAKALKATGKAARDHNEIGDATENSMNTYCSSTFSSGISLVGLLALGGCGGGGGGGDGAVVASPAATTVSGAAAKGLVRQATVLVCRVVNGTVEADPSCASATSADDGTFKVILTDGYTGPAVIKVLAGSATMMQDETTGTPIPYSMTMRAVVPAVAATTTVYVTPFSEMAAHAVGTSGIDADRMRQAMATAQDAMTSLGVDLTVKPVVDRRKSVV